jgi:prepilin signal peptidase PulO-like enzyme (type II secretory pathway)
VIFLASVFGTLVALPLMATGRAGRSSQLPFGPFLLLATVIVVLFGGRLELLYETIFNLS